jgi:sporulation protein YlmC with PRC-barrel domain
MRLPLSLTTAMMLALAAPTLAQTTDEQPDSQITEEGQTPEATAPEPEMGTQPAANSTGEFLPEQEDTQFRAENLLGIPVVNPQGEELGTVDDIVLDENGAMVGLVLSTGGFFGLGAKSVAITFDDVKDAASAESLTVDLSQEQLAAAPPFKTKEQRQQEEEAQQMQSQRQDLQQLDQTRSSSPD